MRHKQLSLITLIFAIPLVLSMLLHHYHTYFSLNTLNHGTLLKKPLDAQYLYSNASERTWRIIYVVEQCDAACKAIDQQLHQLQIALGKDSNRVSVILINSNNTQLEKLTIALSQQEQHQFVVNKKIYLVDPLGNLFMYYPDDVNLMNVMKDLKRVLEVSQIG